MKSFGARLRQQRESHHIELITIAEQTKIKVSLLEALERDDVSCWPSGIFRRAFVRAYAHAAGLDPDPVVREFLETYPEPADDPMAAALAAAAEIGPSDRGPTTRLGYLVGSAIDTLARRRRSSVTPADVQPAGGVDAVESLVDLVSPQPPQSHQGEGTNVVADGAASEARPSTIHFAEPAPADIDFGALAQLSSAFSRIQNEAEIQRLLREAIGVLGATGVVVWIWDEVANALVPALSAGYPDTVVAQLPILTCDADNATVAAFRSSQSQTIRGHEHASGAVAAPLLAPEGCLGVLALEFPRGGESTASVGAAVTIVAALLSQLVQATAAHSQLQVDESIPSAVSLAVPDRVPRHKAS